MKLLELTLATPEDNLACDEALLNFCEGGFEHEILRLWEPTRHFVVVGYANKIASEVHVEACAAAGIPIVRRCSGGGTVVQGPGCLNYSLVLRIDETGPTASVSETNRFVMERNRDALQTLTTEKIEILGHTDLAIAGVKFSGNAQRRRRNHLLFHGSFLLHFDLPLMEQWLRMPTHQPGYRAGRSHREFVRNFPTSPDKVRRALAQAWGANAALVNPPLDAIFQLARSTYASHEWNRKW